MDTLHGILAEVAEIGESTAGAWVILNGVETRLRNFFDKTGVYGPLSRKVLEQVENASNEISHRCIKVEQDLKSFNNPIRR